MALQEQEPETTEQWEELFVNELRVSKGISQKYAAAFVDEGYDGASIKHLLAYSTPGVPSPLLLELGLKAGHCLKLAMYFNPSSTAPSSVSAHNVKVKIPRPIIALDASQNDFDQFCFEWKTYRSHYQLPKESIASHLLYCGSEDVRRRIRIEHPSFTTSTQHSEAELLHMLKAIVLSKTSKIVHCKQFRGIEQLTNEPANDFLARLQLKASCCGFTCSHCGEETVKDRVKEQFILGLANRTVLTAILKTESVSPGTPLDKLLAECMALEQSIKDQQHLRSDSHTDNLFALDDESVSGNEDEQVKALSRPHKQNRNSNNSPMCSGCGKANHHPNEREAECPAWGRKCFGCGVMNHFSSVCRQQNNNQRSNNSGRRSTHFIELACMSAGDSKSNFISVVMRPTFRRNNDFVNKTVLVYPDTGANICLLGPLQLRKLGLKEEEMAPCFVRISVAGGTHIHSTRKTKLEMSLHGKKTKQFVYFSNRADRFFLSKQACIGLGMIPSSFPHPPGGTKPPKEICVVQGNSDALSGYPDSKSSRTELMNIFCDDVDHQEAVESAAEIAGIKQVRTNCQHTYCNHIAPSQARQPLQLIPAPEYPFQHVCVDSFEIKKHQYLVAVDHYSGWNVVFSFVQHPQSKDIIQSLRSLFLVYGTPEKLFSDGGLPFQSQEFKHFLATWKIDHVTSSAHYAQANGRVELAIKAAKRALQENVDDRNSSLNTDGVRRALLQYRNTPIQHLGLSPAQILFHRNLQDGIPTDPRNLRLHRQWIKAAHHREEAFKERNKSMFTSYNRTTRELSPLSVGTTVLIQDPTNKHWWNRSGSIVDVDNRKYVIKMDGSGRVITRNRRFIKPTHLVVESDVAAELLPSASYDDGLSSDQTGSVDITRNPTLDQGGVPTEAVHRSSSSVTDSSGIPRALTRLMPYNMPGLKESQ